MATTPRRPRFSPGLSQDDLMRGYKKIGSRRPFLKKDIVKALKPYGMKVGKRSAKATDSQLAKSAGRAVVRKYKRTQAKKK